MLNKKNWIFLSKFYFLITKSKNQFFWQIKFQFFLQEKKSMQCICKKIFFLSIFRRFQLETLSRKNARKIGVIEIFCLMTIFLPFIALKLKDSETRISHYWQLWLHNWTPWGLQAGYNFQKYFHFFHWFSNTNNILNFSRLFYPVAAVFRCLKIKVLSGLG